MVMIEDWELDLKVVVDFLEHSVEQGICPKTLVAEVHRDPPTSSVGFGQFFDLLELVLVLLFGEHQ